MYLVRIPVIDAMLEIENELMPDFDKKMNEIAENYNIPYLNMMPLNADYNYTDGNHLTINSGKQFSIDLATAMDNSRKQQQ